MAFPFYPQTYAYALAPPVFPPNFGHGSLYGALAPSHASPAAMLPYASSSARLDWSSSAPMHTESSLSGAASAASSAPVYRIVLTGGPCSGKTSALKAFKTALEKDDYDVYCVPEVPTIMMAGGCKYPGLGDVPKLTAFETALLKMQLQAEESFLHVARSTGRKSVIVFDRAMLDVGAYLSAATFDGILAANNWSRAGLMARYDLVLHLVTAADGAEAAYTLSNNETRTETPEQARDLDRKVLKCWEGHPVLRVVDNSTDFPGKLARTTAEVIALIGA